jgi:hypothetical protein
MSTTPYSVALMFQIAKTCCDVAATSAIFASALFKALHITTVLSGVIGPISTLVAFIYLLIRIYETETVKRLLAYIRGK